MKIYNNLSSRLKCVIWIFVCNILQKGISVITTPIFTRLLSTEEYGNYNVFNSWLGIITVIVSMELYKSVFEQGLIKFDSNRKEYYWSIQSLTFLLISLWFVIYFVFKRYWNRIVGLTTTQFLLLFLLILTTAIFRFWAAEQRLLLRYKMMVAITIIVSVMKPSFSILLILCRDNKVNSMILGIALGELFGYGFIVLDQIKDKGFKISTKYWKYGLQLGIPLIPHYLSQTLLESADRIMIGKMVGDSAAGIYSLSSSLSGLMLIVNTSFLYSLSPWIYQHIKERSFKEIVKTEYILLIIVGMCNVILIAAAPEVVSIFAPYEYSSAIWVIPPIAMSSFFIMIYELLARFEFYYEKTWYITIATSTCAVLNIILNYVFIKKYGYIAAGYTTLFCYLFNSIWHYFVVLKITKTETERIYDSRLLILISLFFLTLGLSFILLYKLGAIVRYCIIAGVAIVVIILFKRIRSVIDFKSIFSV